MLEVYMLLTLRQKNLAAQYATKFQRYTTQTSQNDNLQIDQFYKGLKDYIKDELACVDKLDTFKELIELAIRINRRLYKRQLERKGFER